MNQAEDYGRFANALGTLAATFRFQIGEAVPGYWAGCRSLSIEEFESACLLAVEKCENMPVPSNLLKLARDARHKAEGRIQVGMGEWVDSPWKPQPRAQLPGKVRHIRDAPPLPTYAECVTSCQENMDAAIERARNCDETPEGQRTKREALNDVKHWREMRVWYEKQCAAGKGNQRISMGGFAPPDAAGDPQVTRNIAADAAPAQHWSEVEREPGADDDTVPF